jgi:tetratricopeptide (TPR) repeat protein
VSARGARLLALPLLLLLGAALADDESALYFLSRAKDALAAGDLDRASEFLEKSAKEKEGYPPTLLAIAEVAKRRGERETAIRFLDACLAQRQRTDLSASEREAMAAAEKMLAELDEARAQFRKLVADHVGELVRLARATKDPALAKECWRVVLLLDPENAEAQERLGGGDPAPGEAATSKPSAPVKGTPLFNGKNLDGLTGKGPDWSVKGGILTGRVGKAAILSRTERSVTGAFTLTCEMRTKEDLADNPRFGILFGIKGLWDHYGFWVCDDNLRIQRVTGENQGSDVQRCSFKRFSEKYDRSEWHVYRIRVEGRQIVCFIDDQEVFEFNGADRDLDGPVGLFIQEHEAEIRRFVVEQAK